MMDEKMTLQEAIKLVRADAADTVPLGFPSVLNDAYSLVISAAEKQMEYEKTLASIPCCPICANTGRVQKTMVTGQTVTAWAESCPNCDSAYRKAKEGEK
jgi:hypothetical protein